MMRTTRPAAEQGSRGGTPRWVQGEALAAGGPPEALLLHVHNVALEKST